jgi:DNA-binding transcriptional LysR family regulator
VNVPDFIEFEQKLAAVILAETLNYVQAAERLGISVPDLRNQIEALESQLCLRLFSAERGVLLLTDDGRYLIQAFRAALSRH